MSRFCRLLSITLFVVMLLGGCSSNTVRLLYAPSEPGVLPPPTSKRVTVVMLEDKRSTQSIGMKKNGTPFAATSSVPDWASRSLGDSILKLGTQVSYAVTMAEAKRAKPDYIVSGQIQEVWLQETGTAAVTATVRMSLHMTDKNGATVYSENLTATQQGKGVMTTGATENLLVETLRGVTGPAAIKINSVIR